MPEENKPKIKPEYILGGLIIAFLIFAVGFERKQEPDNNRIFALALNNMISAESVHTKTDLRIKLPEKIKDKQRFINKINVTIEGDMTKSEGDHWEMAGNLNVEARGSGNSLYTKGDIVMLKDQVAFNLEEFPALLNPSGKLSKKWTYVPTQMLGVNAQNQPHLILEQLNQALVFEEEVADNGVTYLKFSGDVNEEQEKQIQEQWQLSNSGNRGLDTIARLLKSNNLDRLDVWVNKDKREITKIEANFIRTLPNDEKLNFARLEINLEDYGKEVVINEPEKKLTVKPEVFAKFFDSKTLTDIATTQ